MTSYQFELKHCDNILIQIANADCNNQIDNLVCLGQYCCSKADYLKEVQEVTRSLAVYQELKAFPKTCLQFTEQQQELALWNAKLIEIEAKLKEKGWKVK